MNRIRSAYRGALTYLPRRQTHWGRTEYVLLVLLLVWLALSVAAVWALLAWVAGALL